MTLPSRASPDIKTLPNFLFAESWGILEPERFFSLMNEAAKLVEPGVYFSDNLFTWNRNNSLFDDSAFRTAWNTNIKSRADQAIAWRRYVLACAGYHCVQLAGDFVECGVYWGSGVKIVVDYLGADAFPKTFWCYDTFDYNPVEGHAFPDQKAGFFEEVQQRFAGYSQVKLVKGLIPDVFNDHLPETIAYLHIDLNNAAAEVAALDRLFDHMVPGGVLILDDYEWSALYRGQKIAEDAWFEARKYRVMPLPTGQGLVIKR
jgi:hypothetical protein